MNAGETLFLTIVFLAFAIASPCPFQAENILIDIEPGCPQGEPLNQSHVYIQEEFYVCGELSALTGTITAYEPTIMKNQTVRLENNRFELHGQTNTNQHKVYYIKLNHSNCELNPVPLEVKDKCDQIPPTVKLRPENAIEEGIEFTVEITNLEKDFKLDLTGLKNNVNALIENEPWTQNFHSSDCCEIPPCSCLLKFSFTDARHPICQDNSTTFKLVVNEKTSDVASQNNNLLTLLIVIVIILGTAVALSINRTK